MGKRVNNLALRIVEILRDRTDRDHPMTQAQLRRELEQRCGTLPDRGAIRRNLDDLCDDCRFPIRRAGDEAEDGDLYENYKTDLYYDHPFAPEEVRFLIDGLLFSRIIPAEKRNELIAKLQGLAGSWFQHHMGSVGSLAPDEPANPQLFENIARLSQAIEQKRMVRLTYNYLQEDFRLHPVMNRRGEPLRQPIHPYKLVARNGTYHLICNHDRHDDLSHYRLDRITDVEITEKPRKPLREVYRDAANLDARSYMEKNINMAFGEPERITFEWKSESVADVIDAFGRKVEFTKLPRHYRCVVRVPGYDMFYWALAHVDEATVTAPESLARRIADTLRRNSLKYDRLLQQMKKEE